jgi:CRP/FNR family transcriptional regulator, cyclic AMP receptor protein
MISANDLEQFPIFSGLDKVLLTEIAKLCAKRSYRAGETCVVEGSPAICLHLLVKGKIILERKLPEKWLHHSVGVVYTLHKGQMFGWSALVEPGVHTATARCAEDCEVVLINGKELMAVLDRGGEASYHFMKRLATVIALRLVDTSNFMMREMADFAAYRSM